MEDLAGEKEVNYYRNLPNEKKQENIERNRKRLMEEKTFMKAKYDSIFNRVKSHQKQRRGTMLKDIEVYKCYITWEQLWDLWERHKETHGGLFCAITGEKMTHVGVNPPGTKKYSRNWNNISIDRLDAGKPYTLQNIIFVTWKINKMKNDFPILHMKKILQINEERFGK